MKTNEKESALPEKISLQTLANLSNYSPRRLRQMCAEGQLPAVENGLVPIGAIRELFLFLGRDSEAMRKEKLLKTRAERVCREIQAKTAQGQFKSVEIFDAHCTAMGAAINRALDGCEKDLKNGNTPEVAVDALRGKIATAILEAKIEPDSL